MKLKKVCHLTIILLIVCTAATGCWDSIDLESRGFVVTLGIDRYSEQKVLDELEDEADSSEETNTEDEADSKSDKNESEEEKTKDLEQQNKAQQNNGFPPVITTSVTLPKFGESSSASETNGKILKKADDVTLSAAMKKINSYSGEKMYYGHTKLCVFGEELLGEESLLRECLDALERNRDLNRKTIVLATDGYAYDALNTSTPEDPMIAIFVSNFYKNNSDKVTSTFQLDLETLISRLRTTGTCILPKISAYKDKVTLSGAAVITDFALAGWLDEHQMRSYLWLLGKGKGGRLETPFNNSYVTTDIIKDNARITFAEENGLLVCFIDKNMEGSIDEYEINLNAAFNQEDLGYLQQAFSQIVQDELISIFDTFQNEYKTDAFNLRDTLRKNNYDLYLKYGEKDWETTFEQLQVVARISFIIRNTGSIK